MGDEGGGGLGLRELARELGGAALAEGARGGARAGAAREGFAGEARAAAGAALGLAGAPRRRALVPFGRWAFFEGEVCGAAGGLVARLADGHFAELTAPQAAALLEQRAGASPGAWGLHLPDAAPTGAAAGGGRPHGPPTDAPAAAELGAGAGGSAAPARPPPSTSASAAPEDSAPPSSPAPVARERPPNRKAPAFQVQVREAPPPAAPLAVGGGSSSQGAGGGGGAGTRASAAEPKLRSKFALEFGRR